MNSLNVFEAISSMKIIYPRRAITKKIQKLKFGSLEFGNKLLKFSRFELNSKDFQSFLNLKTES